MVALRVMGVMHDLPHNTQFDIDILVPNTSLANRMAKDDEENWLATTTVYGYVTWRRAPIPRKF